MPISVFSADNEYGGVWQRWLLAPRHWTYVFAVVQGYNVVANVAAAEIAADWMVPSVSSDTLLATETVNGWAAGQYAVHPTENINVSGEALQELFGLSLDQQGVFAVLAAMVGTTALTFGFTYWLDEASVGESDPDPEPIPLTGPSFLPVGSIAFPENTLSGYALTTVVADDAVGLAAEPYALVGDSPFSIEAVTGQIFMTDDVEVGTYSIVVEATNAIGQSSRQPIEIVIVTADHVAPIVALNSSVADGVASLSYLDASMTFISSDNASGFLVGAVTAQDDHAVSYSLVVDDAGLFMIDGDGHIRINTDTSVTDGTYSVTIVATDAAGNSASHDVTITVDVTAPSFEDASARFLVGSGAGNTLVGTASATDANAISYSLVGDDAGSFVIDGVGAISIAGVGTPLSDSTYSVTIVATDAAGNSASHDVTITVDATAPSFEDASARFLVGSGAGNTLVGSTIADDTSSLRYSLVGADAGSFVIDETSGAISIGSVSTPLSEGTYSVTVKAEDAAGNEATHDVTITVDTTAPSFEGVSASFFVGSGAGGTLVGSTIADDTSSLRYSLVGADAGSFVIDETSGAISIGSVSTPLSEGTYSVTVKAEDAAGNEATHDVTITVETPEAIALQYLNKTVFGAADGQVEYSVGTVFDSQASIDSYVVSSGSLPTGISMDESTGYLIGTLVLDDIYTTESFQFGVAGRSGGLVVDHAQFAFDVGLNLVAGDFTESVAYSITGGNGADHVTGGYGFSRRKTSTLTLGDGDNVVVLDGVSRHDDNRNTVVEITAGRGADTLTIGSHWARQSQSSMTIDLGDGDNSFTAGSQVAYEFGRLTFTSGTGDDVVIMGSEIGFRNGAKATLQTGAGNDKISVGNSAGGSNGGFELDSGEGDDVVLMGNMNSSNAGLSNLVLGAGADQLVVAANSGGANMTLTLDTGDISSADLVVFLGSISINNGIDFGLGDVLAFPAGQMFDEFTDSNTATISGLTNAQVSLRFANTVTATWSEKDVTYQQLANDEWTEVTANMTVVEFVGFV